MEPADATSGPQCASVRASTASAEEVLDFGKISSAADKAPEQQQTNEMNLADCMQSHKRRNAFKQ